MKYKLVATSALLPIEQLNAATATSHRRPALLLEGQYFHIGKVLGKGAFSTVYSCSEDRIPEKPLALKVDRSHLADKDIEYSILRKLNHENILTLFLHGRFGSRGLCTATVSLLEYAHEGTLYDRYLNPKSRICDPQYLNSTTLTVFAIYILRGLRYLQSKNIIHHDLKPENIFLVRHKRQHASILKIGDFGNAIDLGEHDSYQCRIRCSRYYRSPEEAFNSNADTRVDTWAFGNILYELMTGHPLLPSASNSIHQQKIIEMLGPAPIEFIHNTKSGFKTFRTPSVGNLESRLSEVDVKKHDETLIWLLRRSLLYPNGSNPRYTASQLRNVMKSSKAPAPKPKAPTTNTPSVCRTVAHRRIPHPPLTRNKNNGVNHRVRSQLGHHLIPASAPRSNPYSQHLSPSKPSISQKSNSQLK